MGMMVYNREKCLRTVAKTGKRSIRIDRYGNLSVTTALVSDMQLEDGDMVTLANDEDDTGKWYLCKVKDGFPVRIDRSPRKTNRPINGEEVCYGARFHSRWLCNRILDCAGVEGPATFMISQKTIRVEGSVYYRIITSNPITREKRLYVRNRKTTETGL